MTELKYSDDEIEEVWEKGDMVVNYNPKIFRKDGCGAWIKKSDYGKRDSAYGWEIDHKDPYGPDDISNYRPLHWKNNVATSDSGKLTCPVQANGDRNEIPSE
jgi:hypothetical protein